MQAIQKRKNEPKGLADFKKKIVEGVVTYSKPYKTLSDDKDGAFAEL